jgi:hypothetical protein
MNSEQIIQTQEKLKELSNHIHNGIFNNDEN